MCHHCQLCANSLPRPKVTPSLLLSNETAHECPHQSIHGVHVRTSPPHQIKFDTDSQKFLIDSGASAHLWNQHKDFISYHALSPQERKNDQVFGVSGEAIPPQGIGSIWLRSRMTSTTSIQSIFTTSGTYQKHQSTSLSHRYSPNNAKPRETLIKLFDLSSLHLPPVDRRQWQNGRQIHSLEQEQHWHLLHGFWLQAI